MSDTLPASGGRTPVNSSPTPLARVAIATSGGLLAAFCFEPVGAGWLAPMAMALLWISLSRTSWRTAIVPGLCFGLVFMLVLLWWLEDSIGWGAWLGLATALAIPIAIAGLGIRAVALLPGGPLWAAAIWISVEELRSSWPLGGMPWGRLGFGAIDTPWQSLLPYSGITGAGFIIAAGGFAIAHACLAIADDVPSATLPVAGAILGAATVVVLATVAWPFRAPVTDTTTIAVIQGGVPGDGRDLTAHHRRVTSNHVEATIALASELTDKEREDLSLVLWPENSTAVDPVRDPLAHDSINTAAKTIGVPILVGGIIDGPTPDTARNRGIIWQPDGHTEESYTKTHLVPFGEFIPWRSMIGDWVPRFDRVPRDMLPGRDEGPLTVTGMQVADAICFDIAYDDVLPRQVDRGAQIAVVQTSNATFTDTTQPEQQFEITRARAAELGRTIIVASTNGISGIIAPDGSVTQRTTGRGTETLVAEVVMAERLTPAVRFQSIWQPAMLAIAGMAMLTAIARGRPRSVSTK